MMPRHMAQPTPSIVVPAWWCRRFAVIAFLGMFVAVALDSLAGVVVCDVAAAVWLRCATHGGFMLPGRDRRDDGDAAAGCVAGFVFMSAGVLAVVVALVMVGAL